ncbi:chitin binding peritrophin-A domain-containing protein [Aspergillus fijiensis CBS 313.89]|uniref:Chitin-binding type-2 domain-containing protein n=1 Tax=Aspergillus fijiensis CBS 313.89 TaxID=1448319 RepID=A0A8G1REE3_9EURO|nr:uncharacterized protein BO72DRAFT_532015 [Aspergillus fijiensis CBS 313.89]RAK72292.1 hypothetical protein BO72DRAFT_532015 [Aspergillus fijiensis CBS 313.89]
MNINIDRFRRPMRWGAAHSSQILLPSPVLPLTMRLLHQALTVFLAAVLLDTAAAADCRPGATRPDRFDCHAYHRCDAGEFVRLHCAPGQAYSVYTGTCEPEWRSPGCHQGVTQEIH